MQEIKKTIDLNILFKRQLKKLSNTILKINDPSLIPDIIADQLYALSKNYNINMRVDKLDRNQDDIDLKFWGNFSLYFQFDKIKLRDRTSQLSCTEIAQYMTIVSKISFDTSLIESLHTGVPMSRNDLGELLQLSDETCRVLIKKLVSISLLSEGDCNYKHALYCPRNLAQKNSKNYKKKEINTVPNFKSKWIISSYLFEQKIFRKNDKSDRKSNGKETLGVFMKLVFLMNDVQIVKSRKKQELINYLKSNIKVADIESHLKLLISNNFIQINNNVLYVNPTVVKKSKIVCSEYLVSLFKLNLSGAAYQVSPEVLDKERKKRLMATQL